MQVEKYSLYLKQRQIAVCPIWILLNWPKSIQKFNTVFIKVIVDNLHSAEVSQAHW